MSLAAAVLLLATPSVSASSGGKNASCADCHQKANPRPGHGGLRDCPAGFSARKGGPAPHAGLPDVVILDGLVDEYGPVKFSHKAHADMAQMGDGCWLCHHNSPMNQKHPACETCHKKKPDRKNPSMIRLEAAYHRHCIDCHRQWSHEEDCELCHAAKKGKAASRRAAAPRRNFKRVAMPGKKVYRTDNKSTMVTFFHDEHVGLFRISCDNCHTAGTCTQCHGRTTVSKPAVKPGHATCSGCHDTKNPLACAKCHRTAPMGSYSHSSTKFPLGAYHGKLECGACHYAHNPIRKLDGDCRSCHKGLSFKSFNHETTGFSLKPYHATLKCVSCHEAGKPMRLPKKGCKDCHVKMVPENFDHAAVGIPLESYHKGVSCDKCHPKNDPLSKPPTKCGECH